MTSFQLESKQRCPCGVSRVSFLEINNSPFRLSLGLLIHTASVRYVAYGVVLCLIFDTF